MVNLSPNLFKHAYVNHRRKMIVEKTWVESRNQSSKMDIRRVLIS